MSARARALQKNTDKQARMEGREDEVEGISRPAERPRACSQVGRWGVRCVVRGAWSLECVCVRVSSWIHACSWEEYQPGQSGYAGKRQTRNGCAHASFIPPFLFPSPAHPFVRSFSCAPLSPTRTTPAEVGAGSRPARPYAKRKGTVAEGERSRIWLLLWVLA